MALAALLAAAAAVCWWPSPGGGRLRRAIPARGETAESPARTRVITRAARRRTAVSTRGLPLALDLLSVCLSAGLPPAGAIGAVAAGLTGGLGSALAAVQRALALGAPAGQAWAPAVAATPALGRVADRFVQAERSGAALAPALAALAADERRSLQLARARAARRVGVLAAAPLGLCFLPAFVITGVLPIVGGLVHAMARS